MEFYQTHFLFPDFKPKAFTLSYDDANREDFKMVELLNKYGVKCTFNLNSNSLPTRFCVHPEEVSQLYKGHEVACHSLTHPALEHLTSASASYQILEDRRRLEEIVKRPVQGMAYPYGIDRERLPSELLKQCGIHYSRTTNSTHNFEIPTNFIRWDPTCHHNDSKLESLIEKFNQPQTTVKWPCLFFVWGHSYEFADNWEPLENMLKKVSDKKDVWYATNGEICDYITAFYRLEHSVNGKYIYNPTNTTLYFRANKTLVEIKGGERIEL